MIHLFKNLLFALCILILAIICWGIGKVIFSNSKFWLIDYLGGYFDSPEWRKCEVIGNIFENYELFKGGK